MFRVWYSKYTGKGRLVSIALNIVVLFYCCFYGVSVLNLTGGTSFLLAEF